MNKSQAETRIQSIFQRFSKASTLLHPTLLSGLNNGKLYELYVLSELVLDLDRRGFQVCLTQSNLKFKAAPGRIKFDDPHIVVTAADGSQLRLFVDIEFETLGKSRSHASDLSTRHELDLVLVNVPPKVLLTNTAYYPLHDQIYLAVECKCVANFRKNVVREALGVRRELSYLSEVQKSLLTHIGGPPTVSVPAEPASEFWLAFIDRAGTNYERSPAAFGIDLKHIEP